MQKEMVFDSMASGYDQDFTYTPVGRSQRRVVHRYLRRVVRQDLNVLEINCGTGEDALFLASQGCLVTATDSSEKMINEACIKGSEHPYGQQVTFLRVPFSDLGSLKDRGPFDLILSNFSGLNCMDPAFLPEFSETLSDLLCPGGNMILVLFGRKCLWEQLYLLIKGKFTEIHRRQRNTPITAGPPGEEIRIWYHSRHELPAFFEKSFSLIGSRPVGLFLPPSYLGHFFRNKALLLGFLALNERIFGGISAFSEYADHYLIHFRKL